MSAPDKKTGSANLDNSHWPQRAKQSDLTESDYGSHAVSATDKKTGSVNLGNSHLSQRAKRSDLTGSDPQTQIPLAQSSRVFHQIPSLFPVVIGKIGRNRSWEVAASCYRRAQRASQSPPPTGLLSLHLFCPSRWHSVPRTHTGPHRCSEFCFLQPFPNLRFTGNASSSSPLALPTDSSQMQISSCSPWPREQSLAKQANKWMPFEVLVTSYSLERATVLSFLSPTLLPDRVGCTVIVRGHMLRNSVILLRRMKNWWNDYNIGSVVFLKSSYCWLEMKV